MIAFGLLVATILNDKKK
ncbi:MULTISPECIES: hypothetical protein [Lacticaseibacillus]